MHVSRSGFTAIELITVLAIITTLASMTVPAAMRAMDKGAVNRSAEGLRSVIMQAQDMARRQAAPTAGTSPASYGVAVVQSGGRAYATILYGTTLSDELMVDGQPVQRVDLGPGVHIRTSVSTEPSQPLNGSVGWFLAPTNGLPVENAGDAMVIDVGTEPQAARGRDFRSGSGSS
ncbi:MAG: type II secretion system protein, partial [Planctomycetota bacterium]|nr:type II secretion system protein [Planctomycetota bacterium]